MTIALTGPECSLLFFLGLFFALLAWLFVFARRNWQREARLPLDEGPVPNEGIGGQATTTQSTKADRNA
ncbi:MAG: hypothetical protein DWH97_00945 [Planctomycetota bacterium]|jgi:cbb3-type cytochrome oxidase subunit 3|nr:MAG: hypothetical protein DWH97_00945 [Planctomycetota bacterium]RLS91268.1 MAG: hypothetical protein DWI10_06655 [Planctomycetota bacterium]